MFFTSYGKEAYFKIINMYKGIMKINSYLSLNFYSSLIPVGESYLTL